MSPTAPMTVPGSPASAAFISVATPEIAGAAPVTSQSKTASARSENVTGSLSSGSCPA
ncbi:hypothetical protein [Mangrovicoccus ximenensis]|uniref:hypothetical protein n=1 Tax=Mangrovicoccus ximenensis TaxID=1911570 RepID=UPI0013749B31|nr:hypothetical protein [Mangrovicoccus ximenensis]